MNGLSRTVVGRGALPDDLAEAQPSAGTRTHNAPRLSRQAPANPGDERQAGGKRASIRTQAVATPNRSCMSRWPHPAKARPTQMMSSRLIMGQVVGSAGAALIRDDRAHARGARHLSAGARHVIAFASVALTHSADHLAAGTLVLLGVFAFAGGVGTTALGPGGVLVTIGLFLLSGLPPAAVSGTAIATNLGAAVLGTGAFVRSGQLGGADTGRVAVVLVGAAVLGTPIGVVANARISGGAFGILLGVCVAAIGVLLYVREHQLRPAPRAAAGPTRRPGWTVIAPIGLGVAVVSGLFGLGGQLLSVPLLVSAGIAMLPALGAAQAQSIAIAGIATLGYALRGAIAWPLVAVMGVPLVAGAVAGWRIANALPADRLRSVLAAVLVATGAYLILHNA
jgi:uncharacterized protein